ncbi:MAG: protease modulator HflC [Alphaproteobacteria bacterium]
MSKTAIFGGILAIVIGITAFSSLFVIRENEQALILQFGNPQKQVDDAGLNFKTPFIQDVIYFDKRILDYDASAAEIPTLDQKQLVVDAFARYKIIDPLKFYQTVATESIAESQLNNIINSNLRDSFGKQLFTKLMTETRAKLMAEISKKVDTAMRSLGIQVIDVRIKRVDLPEENSQAIFRRMQTQREQEARRIRAEGDRKAREIRADADKQQRVIVAEAKKTSEILRGEGDAVATKLYNDAFGRDRDFFDFYRSLQAMRTGLIGDTTSYVGPPQGEFYRFFKGESLGSSSGK